MLFKIPVPSEFVRTVKDPTAKNPNSKQTRIIHAYVNVNDLPHDLPLDPDPRSPKRTGNVPKRISESLVTNDGRFHLLNRGITMSVKHAEFDNTRSLLSLSIPTDEEAYGIIDGGHTYDVITRAISKLRQESENMPNEDSTSSGKAHEIALNEGKVLPNQFVHLEILERIEAHLADIAEARNFSVALKPWTLANYRDRFEWLLHALGEDFKGKIRVSENDQEPVGIVEILQVISAVNPILFPEEKPAIDAYNAASKILEWFIDQEDKYSFKKLAPVAKDIVRLYDYIRLHFHKKYNAPDDSGKRGLLGGRVEFKQRKNGKTKDPKSKKVPYYFLSPNEVVYGDTVIEKGFAIPLLSGYRLLLREDDKGEFKWLTDPFKFFDQHGTKFARAIMDISDSFGNNPHSVGREPQSYRQISSEFRRWYLENLELERTSS
jgi:hypothetical protein